MNNSNNLGFYLAMTEIGEVLDNCLFQTPKEAEDCCISAVAEMYEDFFGDDPPNWKCPTTFAEIEKHWNPFFGFNELEYRVKVIFLPVKA